jgi:hypothetical protein
MITAGASRVAPDPLCLHAVATTPAGPMERIRSLLLHRLRPSPDYSWVGSCIISFVACSAFTHVTTYRLAKSPYATLYTGGSGGFVAATAAPIATGWSDPVPGRAFLPAVDQRLFTAHCKCPITAIITSQGAVAWEGPDSKQANGKECATTRSKFLNAVGLCSLR